MGHRPRKSSPWMGALAVAVAIVGLVGASSATAGSLDSSIGVPQAETAVTGAVAKATAPEGAQLSEVAAAERGQRPAPPGTEQIEEYDPWETYNEKIFAFNHDVFDRFILKPVATAWDKVVPTRVQQSFSNAYDNIGMPRRVVNNALQAKFKGAGNELARFCINSTVGIAGFFDVAKAAGIEKSDEDTGQTLGVWGVGPGPYLILPFLPPLTARDAFGFAADVAMDPLNYFIPLAASFGSRGGDTINTRSQNLEFFESVEETTVDLYSAVRNAYLQRRQRAIAE